MMIPIEVITTKICGWRMLTSRIAIASTPTMTAGMIGVFVFGCTRARVSPAGRLLSRAIANIMRIVAVCTARQQTVIAITTDHRKMSPIVLPRTSRMMNCRPPTPISGLLMLVTDIIANSRIRPPMMNEAISARRIARGAFWRGLSDSSPSELAVSNPYMT